MMRRKTNPVKHIGKIAVWWDMKDCPVPEGFDARWVRPSIVRAFRKLGFTGCVSISAYGDHNQTPDHVLQGLISTRVQVLHTDPESICERILTDLLEWRRSNPPPATVMLISDQVEDVFSWALLRLQQQTPFYRFCLAYESKSPEMTMLSCVKTWNWSRLHRVSSKRSHLANCSDSSGALFCKLCHCDAKTLEDFRQHLSSPQHALQLESRITPSSQCEQQPLESCFLLQRLWGENSPAGPKHATAQIAVWWCMEDCPIPDYFDPWCFRPALESAFGNLGYTGPVSICAYGNLKQIPKHSLQALSSTGVKLLHIVTGVEYKHMFSDMLIWRRCNPPPATMMLISNHIDPVFSSPLVSVQRQSKYNIFVASLVKPSKTSVLVSSAEWLWEDLLKAGMFGREREVRDATDAGSEELTEFLMPLPWALVHSHQTEDVQRVIAMLEASLADSSPPLEYREKLYLLAVAYLKSGEYAKSRQLVDRCIEMQADWRQAFTLKKVIEEEITKGRHLGECSQSTGMLCCRLCRSSDFKSVDDILEHLFTSEHQKEEDIIFADIERRRVERAYWQSREEKMQKKKLLKDRTIDEAHTRTNASEAESMNISFEGPSSQPTEQSVNNNP